jgi:hypothetical protein
MRLFNEEWQQYLLPEKPTQTIRLLSTNDIQINLLVINRPLLKDDFDKLNWECFLCRFTFLQSPTAMYSIILLATEILVLSSKY